MNKKFEKWLTIAALGSWVASMGALVAIEVASVLDSQFYQQLKQTDAVISLEPDRGHWLDHTLISHEILNRDFSGSDVKSLPSSEEMLIHDHNLRSVWMLAQIPESWHRLPNK